MKYEYIGDQSITIHGNGEEGTHIRRRFAWLPIHRWSSEWYRNRSYWLRSVVERKTPCGWKAFESDN